MQIHFYSIYTAKYPCHYFLQYTHLQLLYAMETMREVWGGPLLTIGLLWVEHSVQCWWGRDVDSVGGEGRVERYGGCCCFPDGGAVARRASLCKDKKHTRQVTFGIRTKSIYTEREDTVYTKLIKDEVLFCMESQNKTPKENQYCLTKHLDLNVLGCIFNYYKGAS